MIEVEPEVGQAEQITDRARGPEATLPTRY